MSYFFENQQTLDTLPPGEITIIMIILRDGSIALRGRRTKTSKVPRVLPRRVKYTNQTIKKMFYSKKDMYPVFNHQMRGRKKMHPFIHNIEFPQVALSINCEVT
jgi:hypothetical protein